MPAYNRKTDTLEFGTTKFVSTQLPATRALRLLARLLKLAAPLVRLADLLPKTKDGKLNMDEVGAVALENAGPILTELAVNLQPDEVEDLACEILAGTVVTGQFEDGGPLKQLPLLGKDALNLAFSGNLRQMLSVMIAAVRLNFADFALGGAGAKKPDAPGLVPVPETPST